MSRRNAPDPEELVTEVPAPPAPAPAQVDAEAAQREAYRQKVRDDLAARRRHVADQIRALQAQDADLERQMGEV